MPEKEVKAVAEALQSRFRQALDAGRLSQVINLYLAEFLSKCCRFLSGCIFGSLVSNMTVEKFEWQNILSL